MENSDVVFDDCIASFEIEGMCVRERETSSQPKQSASSHDRHFSHFIKNRILPQHGEGATIVRSAQKHKRRRHKQMNFLLPGRNVDTLRSTHHFGVGFRPFSQPVVHNSHQPKLS